ncbi:MAG TPA: DNA polymerase III subunit gamma/tau [Candidatus Avelusimicrobium excrementipullorum]|nr:DNA polymerase III subunit gamma/tau [Candidatus Avelusimicrobium excrementipullorum]
MSEENTTPYVSLANKYRPQKFEDLVGQESISKTLQNALKLGRIAHAYLFYGPRGCGKTTTARILAKALNCTGHGHDKPTAEPCGQCPQCREIARSEDLDVLELDAASNTQVEKVREAIIDTVALAASRDRYKVFILDEVHMLSASSFNALLKTIEEPPQHVVFILATTEKHKVPATIVSRCQTFRFRPMTSDEITNHLMDLAEAEGLDLTEKAARIIAKNAGGAMRDALTLMDRAIAYSDGKIDDKLVGEMLGLTPQDLLSQTVGALIDKDSAALHGAFETLRAEGFDANAFLKDLKNALGDLFYFSLGQGAAPFDGAQEMTARASAGLLAALSRKVNKLAEEVKFSDNALVSAEVGLFTVMDSCFDVDGFIRRLEALERGEGGISAPPASGASRPAAVKKAASPQANTPTHFSASAASAADVHENTASKRENGVAAAQREALSGGTHMSVQAKEPVPSVNVSAVAQSEPAAVSRPAAQASSETGALITDNRQLWDALLKAFSASPFVYDVMTNCSVHFDGDSWTISFGKGKEFYKVPAQNKLPDLEKQAFKLSGRHIKFQISVSASASAAQRPAAQAPSRPAPVSATGSNRISDEEPFVKADFSADIEPASSKEVPEELKGILDVIGGEVLA